MSPLLNRLEHWFWRKAKAKTVGPFVPGMTLAPGESAELKIEIPPEYHAEMFAAQERGETVGIINRGSKQVRPGHYRAEIELVVGGKVLAVMNVEYSA